MLSCTSILHAYSWRGLINDIENFTFRFPMSFNKLKSTYFSLLKTDATHKENMRRIKCGYH
jgi:hypothetical protein